MGFATCGFGQATFWNATGTGNFNTGSNWNSGVPTDTTDALILNGTIATPTVVNLGPAAGASVQNLTLGANNTLNVGLGSVFAIYGTSVSLDGTLAAAAGSGNNTDLEFNGSATLSGSGGLTLSYGDGNGDVFVEQSSGGVVLTNLSTIVGDGMIGNGGLALVNGAGGIVNANIPGQVLTLNGTGGVTNGGLLEATGGGVLQISSAVANGGGSVTANGGTVNVSSTITGGTLDTLASGVIQTSVSAVLSGVTLSGGSIYTGPFNTTTGLVGTIANNGEFQLFGGSGNNTYLAIDSNVTLQGGGAMTLNSGDTNGIVFIQQSGGSFTLTNVDNLIQGYGDIGDGGLGLTNSSGGTVDANGSGRVLTLDGTGGVTNSGLIEATAAGVLQITTSVANSGGQITAYNGTVDVSSTLSGGTLTTLGTGIIQTNGSAILSGLTLSGSSSYTGPFGTTTGLVGTITNDGAFQLFAGSGNNTQLNIDANVTLQGGGVVTLNSGDINGAVFIQQNGGSFTLTNADNTIQGYGDIGHGGLTFINASGATVNANISGRTLTLDGVGGVTNVGLMEAVGGGVLQISTPVNNLGGTITAASGDVDVSTSIQGGALTGGNLATNGSATLDGSTQGVLTLAMGSVYTAPPSSITTLMGTLSNLGSIQLFAGSGTNSFLDIVGSVTLQGGGTVVLDNGDNNGRPYIQESGSSQTLTNVSNAIVGAGTIGNGGLAFVNGSAGTVNASISGQVMVMNGSGNVANAGLLEATAGGVLQVSNVVDNSGNISSAGGSVVFNGGTVEGGALNGAILETSGSAILDGITHGPITLSAGSVYTLPYSTSTDLFGVIVNEGTFEMFSGSGNNTSLDIAGHVTLEGGGTISLNNGDNNGRPFVQQSVGGQTLDNVDNSIVGAGTIGNGGLTLVNEVGGTVNANLAGQVMLINSSNASTNTGTFEATNGGILQITNTVANVGGTVLANGGTVVIDGGGSVQGGLLASANGGTLRTDGSAVLDGSSGTLTLATGSTYLGQFGTTTNLLGTIANAGSMQFDAGSGNNTALNIVGSVTLQGGGAMTLNSGDNNGQSWIQQSGSALLTNAGDVIDGYGIIGNGGLSFMNTLGGIVTADAPGQTLLVNASGTVTNDGLFEANDSTLSVASVLTNLTGTTLTGGTWEASSGGTLSFETTTNPIVTNDATLVLDGASSTIRTRTGSGSSYQTVEQTLAANNGTLEVLGARNFAASNALANDGMIQLGGGTLTAPSLTSGSASSVAGFGTFSPAGGVSLSGGATVSPGSAAAGSRINTLSFGTSLTLGPGGVFAFDLKNSVAPIAGTDNDTVNVAGTLFVTAVPTNPFTITLGSIDPASGNPGLANFNPTLNYSWTLASAGAVSGFNAADFTFNTGAFQNPLDGGFFQVSEIGNSLVLNFEPVPEPSTWALIFTGLGAIALATRRRHRRISARRRA